MSDSERAMPTLVPRPDGKGALLSGGLPGNRGGQKGRSGRRPKSAPTPDEIIAAIDRAVAELTAAKRRVRKLFRARPR